MRSEFSFSGRPQPNSIPIYFHDPPNSIITLKFLQHCQWSLSSGRELSRVGAPMPPKKIAVAVVDASEVEVGASKMMSKNEAVDLIHLCRLPRL